MNPGLADLPRLQAESGKSLPSSIIYGFSSNSDAQEKLVRTDHIRGRYVSVLRAPPGVYSNKRKFMTFDPVHQNFMRALNVELMGGRSYPVLEAVLGTVVGAASGGAGLIFAGVTLGVSLSRRESDVLARAGDELWAVEEIGKQGTDPVHIMSYLLVDPFRSRAAQNQRHNGWLLHESRTPLVLE